MAWYVNILVAKSDDLNSTGPTGGKRQLLQVGLWLPRVFCGTCVPTQIHSRTDTWACKLVSLIHLLTVMLQGLEKLGW